MKNETRRLNKLKDTSRNLAKRYKLSEAALKIIEKAGKIHGQQSRAIQVAVELLWEKVGWAPDSAMSAILDSPLTGKTYKLPPRTVSLIEALSHEYGTQGKVLSAVAYMLSKPDPREGLTPAPGPLSHEIVYAKGETAKTLRAKNEQELKARKAKRRKRYQF
jgi:hypothetical protein